MRFGRRHFVGAVGASAFLGGLASAPTANAKGDVAARIAALDPLRTVMRLRGSADGALTMSYLEAVREVVVEGDIVPFCDLKAFVLARYVPRGDVFEAQILECAYYTDPATGEVHERFTFPGQTAAVKVPKYRTGPITVRFANDLDEWETVNPGNKGEASADFAPPSSVRLQRNVSQPWLDGDTMLIRTNEYGRAYTDRAKPPAVFYREWIIWRGQVEDILGSDAPSLPSEYSYASMSSWRPWMKMGDTLGHTIGNGRGKKIASADDLPADIQTLVMKHDPDVIDNPEKALSNVAIRG